MQWETIFRQSEDFSISLAYTMSGMCKGMHRVSPGRRATKPAFEDRLAPFYYQDPQSVLNALGGKIDEFMQNNFGPFVVDCRMNYNRDPLLPEMVTRIWIDPGK